MKITIRHTLEVHQDNFAESARMWSNLTKMYCYHPRSNYGDTLPNGGYPRSVEEVWNVVFDDLGIDMKVPSSEEEKATAIEKIEEVAYCDWLSIYDHSGVALKRGELTGWDYSVIGLVYIKKEDMEKEFGEYDEAKAERILAGEVAIYGQFISGEVYCYNYEATAVLKINDNEVELGTIDEQSCCGFYGDRIRNSGIADDLFPVAPTGEERLAIINEFDAEVGYLIDGEWSIEREVVVEELCAADNEFIAESGNKIKEMLSSVKEALGCK